MGIVPNITMQYPLPPKIGLGQIWSLFKFEKILNGFNIAVLVLFHLV
jgi:hypothetical protein